jgi:hypothetical protein
LCLVTLASLMTESGKFTAVLVHKAINYLDEDDDAIDNVSLNNQSNRVSI